MAQLAYMEPQLGTLGLLPMPEFNCTIGIHGAAAWQFWAALDAGAIELKLLLMAGALRYDESVCWLYFTWNSRLLFQG